jgi:pimeloyl-ACP methyl ester carboxylesterase
MLHGNGESKSCFSKQLPVFSELFRCVVIESRGHGSSTHGSEKLSLSLMADDVFAVMDELQIPLVMTSGNCSEEPIATRNEGR